MGLRDLLKKKDEAAPRPTFTLVRSDTQLHEVLEGGAAAAPAQGSTDEAGRTRSASLSSARRLSQRLLRRSSHGTAAAAAAASAHVPTDLPAIVAGAAPEPQWEQRATILAGQAARAPQPPPAPVASRESDSLLQEAIRLHEAGQLERSTAAFARLADPAGANNALSQVLYGLALRHGWGCAPDPHAAVGFLSAAASNAAAVEQAALQAGLARGGAAKGELVLAIFELANCFRHAWGIPRDPVAAKQYYETAANLGDTDAMNEVAWCYFEGFGCKKDKFAAARYLRRADEAGSKTLGNSWIWKDKYDPPPAPPS